ncbi:pentatricopeptide repeat-containing protein [Micractinium conductrix]|uniref:Pentatricopeptide repeat-containing protein n=1 Tax=Micractinium conductrix TaxID=554055 RepID=A0A2P6V6B2_9CHLO|nr:pentatricopeptide repeat-containing protein [Micractinium conductrix]|eukprot:PSC69633.1 pentatricopeptide repeat-containing protein [Micractinium conductrix]
MIEEAVGGPGLPHLLAGAPGDSKLLRSQTSPSSVLEMLQSPPRGTLMSIAESPGHPEHAVGTYDSPLGPMLGMLGGDAMLGTLGPSPETPAALQRPEREVPVEGLCSQFTHAASLASSSGNGSSLERANSADSGGAAAAAAAAANSSNPFAAASKIVSTLRRASPSSSIASFQIPENEAALFDPGARSGSLPAPPGLLRAGNGIGGAASPHRPASGLARSPSLKRELGIPQLEAAQSLRRAMSCYPELQGADAVAAGAGLASMFNFSHAARVTPNRVCCNALLAAYARAKPPQYQRALHLLAAMWEGGPTLEPDGVSFTAAIKACANAFQVGKALEVYREMVRRGVKPSVSTFNVLITAASDGGSYTALLEVGQCLQAADADVQACCLNSYVAGLVKVGHWEEALARFEAMLGPGAPVRPTASTFNTIMSLHMRQGRSDNVRQVFECMLSIGLHPSIVAWNTLLAALAAQGAWAESLDALSLVLAAQGEGVNPNTTTFNACLAALDKGSPTIPPAQHALVASRALQVFSQLRATPGCAADAATFAHLVHVLSACQQHGQVVALHDLMLREGHTPDASTAQLVLGAALAAGEVHKAFSLAQSLQMQGERVSAQALVQLMSACLGAGALDLGLQLCNAALFAQGSEAAPLFERLLEAAAEAGRFDAVVDTLSAMRAAELPVSSQAAALVMASQAPPPLPPSGPSTPSLSSLVPPPTAPPSLDLGALHSAFERAASSPAAALPPPMASSFSALPAFANAPSLGAGSPSGMTLPPPPPPPLAASPGLSPVRPALAPPPSAGSPSLSPARGMLPPPPPQFNLEDANALLALLKERQDTRGGLEALRNIKLAGLAPDQTSYRTLIELMVSANQPHSAVSLCAEGHEAGSLACYALPNLAGGAPQPGAALGNALDLRDTSLELAITALLTWLTRAAQLQALGLVVRDKHVKVILGQPRGTEGEEGGASAPSPACAALRDELAHLLTTGGTSLPAFHGLVPVQLEAEAVTPTDGGTALLISTPALYRALPAATA